MKTASIFSITGVILSGGQSRRMGGIDKGLIQYNKISLVSHVIQTLAPQVDTLIINANRNIDEYKLLGLPVISDETDNYFGPLSGMLAAMKVAKTDYILTAPCDSPHLSPQLRSRMMESLLIEQADIAVAYDGNRLQPVFCLLPCRLQDELEDYLKQGGRKIDSWFSQYKMTAVDFSDQAESFVNFNTPEDILEHKQPIMPFVPLLGFAAFSGTGKTTLLRKLIPLLAEKGIRTAVVKHAHHQFDIDLPGKDSYELRKSGAQQVLISSCNLMALMEVQSSDMTESKLAELLPKLDSSHCDLILVEGFKHEVFPKIELHRPQLAKPLLYKDDSSIIAIAHDAETDFDTELTQLNLNDPAKIADYIHTFITQWKT